MDNRVTLITTFTAAIVPADAMSTQQARNLVAFLMDCFRHVNKIPPRVADKAERRIKLLRSWQGDVYTGNAASVWPTDSLSDWLMIGSSCC